MISNLPAGGNLGCNPTPPICSTAVTASDNCDGTRPVVCTPGPVTGPLCAQSQVFTYTSADLCGNTATATVTYTWKIDTQAPVISNLPAGGNLGCNPTPPICSTAVTASDNCDGTRPVVCTPGPVTGPLCAQSQVFTYTSADLCGNTRTQTVTYTWKIDTQAPVISNLPAGGNLGCNPTPPICSTAVTASDNCDGTRPVVCTPGPVTGPLCAQSQVFTYTSADLCGNTATATVTYTWKIDTQAPVISNLPAGGNLGCNPTPPICSTAVTASDNCDGTRPVVCTPGPVTGPLCAQSQVFTYTSADLCGNTRTQTVTYTWKIDTQAPVISNLPAGGNLGCNPTPPICSTAVTASDNCDGTRPVVCTPGPVTGPLCAQSQVFTYTSADLCGNTATATVTYTWKIDTQAPVISNLPAGGNLGCNPTPPICSTAVTASDNCDGTRPVVCTPGPVTGPLCAQSQVFTYTSADLCGNTRTQTVTYTWKIDTQAPVISNLPAGGNLGCNPTPPICSTAVTASDNCDGTRPVVCTPGPVTGPLCAQSQVFTYTSADLCGNTATATVTYTWKIDTQAPVISNLPAGGNLGCNPTPPICSTAVTASDNCDGTRPVVCTPGPVTGPLCAQSQVFTYTSADLCGNTATATVTYTWKIDTQAPVISNLPAGGNLGCNPTPPICSTAVTASDNCDGTRPVVCTPGPVTGPLCAQSQVFTYTSADLCGNTKATVTYTWKIDTQAPVISNLPAGGNLGCNPTPPICSTAVTASDNCDGTRPVVCTPGPVTGPLCAQSQVFTYTSADLCGNTATATVTYTWKIDTQAPVISNLPAGGNLGCNPTPPICSTAVTASDNCDGTRPVVCTPGPVTGPLCAQSQVFTYTSADLCGNTRTQR